MTKKEYFALFEELQEACSAKTKSPRQYYIHGRCATLQPGRTGRLIRKRNGSAQELIHLTHVDDMFGIIKRGHVSTSHGGRDIMFKALTKHANIRREGV